MFNRPHHQRIYKLLQSLDSQLFSKAECYFAGGTAIVLLLDEYRESVDADFLCSSPDGYRLLRNAVFERGLNGLINQPLIALRDVRADRYGIRTFVEIDGAPLKFEIVNEGRIALSGQNSSAFGVPLLSRADMYAEKLLANADRFNDKSVLSRDIIDIAMMIRYWGNVPDEAWAKASNAYGDSARKAYDKAIKLVSDRQYLASCLGKLSMDLNLVDQICVSLGRIENEV